MAHSDLIPRPSADLQGRDLGDEYLFYDSGGDRVHVLNGAARAVYLLCDGVKTQRDVALEFAGRYDIDAGTAEKDAVEAIRRLCDLGLLSLS